MIFVTVGSQKFQFNRLLKEIDRLVEEKKIQEEVIAQTGYSDYKPRNYEYKDFFDRNEFIKIMSKCDKVITHGGTGTIVGAVKQGKKVIGIPRLKKFGEHVDDHQLQIIEEFENMNFIKSCIELSNLDSLIYHIEKQEFKNYVSNTKNIISEINLFIYNI